MKSRWAIPILLLAFTSTGIGEAQSEDLGRSNKSLESVIEGIQETAQRTPSKRGEYLANIHFKRFQKSLVRNDWRTVSKYIADPIEIVDPRTSSPIRIASLENAEDVVGSQLLKRVDTPNSGSITLKQAISNVTEIPTSAWLSSESFQVHNIIFKQFGKTWKVTRIISSEH